MLRLMSSNVWENDDNRSNWREKGLDCSAPVRAAVLSDIYASLLPDVIGMQEVTNLMTKEVTRGLRNKGLNYAVIWGNYTPIMYRPDRLELCDADYFPFPEHYDGYEGIFNNGGTKSCCIALFRIKETGKYFLFSTAHLWWMKSDPSHKYYQYGSDEVRALQVDMVIKKLNAIQERYSCPLVFVGDLNSVYDSKAIQMALSRGFEHAHDIAADYACQEHGMHECGPEGYEAYEPKPFVLGIDHILCRDFPEGAVKRFERITTGALLPVTDHAPVWIDVDDSLMP